MECNVPGVERLEVHAIKLGAAGHAKDLLDPQPSVPVARKRDFALAGVPVVVNLRHG